jgi:hypothetical protein
VTTGAATGASSAAPNPAGLRPSGVPVTPDADEARRWAEEELARGVYAERANLVERLVTWVSDRLADLAALGEGRPGWVLPAAVVVLSGLAVAVALVVAGPVRRRRARVGSAEVFVGDGRTAEDLRAAADRAAAAGDHAAAVLDRFRALVRGLTERVIIDDRPGLTADEAASRAGVRLPGHAADLAAAAALFDEVRYGHRGVGADEDAWLAALDARLRAARPALEPAAGS